MYDAKSRSNPSVAAPDPALSMVQLDMAEMMTFAAALVAALAVVAWLYHTALRHRNARDEYFYSAHTRLCAAVVRDIQENLGPYRPPWWYNPHIASVVSFGTAPQLQYVHTNHYHEDGTMYVCSWFPHAPAEGADDKVVILCPGLGLDALSLTMKVAVHELACAGHVVVVMNPKGFMHPLTTARCYCCTDISDLEHLTEHVIPSTCKVFIMGYSAGSNVAARFASYGKNRQRISAVALVCTISKYQQARELLECGAVGQLYSYGLGFKYQQMLVANESVLKEKASRMTWTRLKREWVRLSDMDKVIAEEFLSYSSEEHYLLELNHAETLADLKIPALVLQSKDDPLFGGRCESFIPKDLHAKNPNSVLILNDYGGHFGFVGGWSPFDATGSYRYPVQVANMLFQRVIHDTTRVTIDNDTTTT